MRTSAPRDAITNLIICGKPVAIFDDHHHALIPWTGWRPQFRSPPRLLTLDFHTDKHRAFLRWSSRQADPHGNFNPDPNLVERFSQSRLDEIQALDQIAIDLAVQDLRHDEHLDTALAINVLDIAFVVSCNQQGCLEPNEIVAWENGRPEFWWIKGEETERPTGPFSYTLPKNRLVILPDNADRHDDTAFHAWRDKVLETNFLSGRLKLINEICMTTKNKGFFEEPFILDIDLDVFNTWRAIAPSNTDSFYDIVRRASCITVAREPGCVEECQISGEGLSAGFLEKELLEHLRRALS